MSQYAYGTTAVSRTSNAAVAALVLWILTFLCLGPLTGIAGVICGIVGIVGISRSQGALKGSGLAIAGLVTSAVGMVAWLAVVPLFVAILLPSLSRAREMANRTVDMSNARQISMA